MDSRTAVNVPGGGIQSTGTVVDVAMFIRGTVVLFCGGGAMYGCVKLNIVHFFKFFT